MYVYMSNLWFISTISISLSAAFIFGFAAYRYNNGKEIVVDKDTFLMPITGVFSIFAFVMPLFGIIIAGRSFSEDGMAIILSSAVQFLISMIIGIHLMYSISSIKSRNGRLVTDKKRFIIFRSVKFILLVSGIVTMSAFFLAEGTLVPKNSSHTSIPQGGQGKPAIALGDSLEDACKILKGSSSFLSIEGDAFRLRIRNGAISEIKVTP